MFHSEEHVSLIIKYSIFQTEVFFLSVLVCFIKRFYVCATEVTADVKSERKVSFKFFSVFSLFYRHEYSYSQWVILLISVSFISGLISQK